MFTLVDSNVILDVVTDDPQWCTWSSESLARAAETSTLAVNPIIFAEVSIGFRTIEEIENLLPAADFRRLELPYEAAFLAGKAFLSYRRRGGRRSAPLPDFYIGAHAAIAGMQLLTRDPRRYRTYFPGITIVAP
ncbi:MAG TPA: type II toxin-antitoxin system VapC family toxin [Thermoanaerobaculia bacterium]